MGNPIRLYASALVAALLVAGVSCSRDPNIVKLKYVQNGNRYFDKGKYKEAYIMYRKALEKDRKYGEAYYRLALTDLRLGRVTDALRDFQRAADSDPNNVDARVQLGELYLVGAIAPGPNAQTFLPELKRVAKELTDRNPKSVPGIRLQGYVDLLEKNTKKAVQRFELANQLSPMRPDVVLPLSQALINDNRWPEAEKLSLALIDKDKTFRPIYDLLVTQYLRLNRLADAEGLLKRKAANNPKDAQSLLDLASFYYRTNHKPEMTAAVNTLISKSKELPEARVQAGYFYRAINDADSAMRVYQDGIAHDPERKARYQKLIAEVLIAQGKREDALKLLQQVRKDNPKDEQANAFIASLMIDSGNKQQIDQAVTELQAAVGQEPNNPVTRYNLGRALLAKAERTTDPSARQVQFDQARIQLEKAAETKNYLQPRLTLARLNLARHQYDMALKNAQLMLEVDGKNLQARLVRTSALAGMGNRAQARTELDGVIRDYPTSVDAYMQRGMLDFADQHYKEAEATFLKVYRANPSDLSGLMGLVETYVAQNQPDKAIQTLRAELAKKDSPAIHVAIGNVAYRSGNYDLAIQEFTGVVKQNPNAGDAYVRLAESYLKKGDTAAAISNFERAKQLLPNDPMPYLRLALVLDGAGHKDQAKPLYEQVLKLNPEEPVALNNLAYQIAENGGDLDTALALAQRARQRLPHSPDVADTLGWIYIKKNLSDSAVQIFRELVAEQPNNSTYRYHFAMALLQKGDRPQARKELQTALEQKPTKEQEGKIRALMGKVG